MPRGVLRGIAWRVALTRVGADVRLAIHLSSMRAVDLIRKKRDSGEHSRDEIDFLIRGYTRGRFPTTRYRRG